MMEGRISYCVLRGLLAVSLAGVGAVGGSGDGVILGTRPMIGTGTRPSELGGIKGGWFFVEEADGEVVAQFQDEDGAVVAFFVAAVLLAEF